MASNLSVYIAKDRKIWGKLSMAEQSFQLSENSDAQQANAGRRRVQVALVEDHSAIAIGVAAMLSAAENLHFVGGYPTVSALIKAEQGHAFPKVVLLDLRLGDNSDPAVNVQRLRELGAGVIVYTSGEEPYLVRRACEGGVLGVVRKAESPQVLIDTIQATIRGELTPSVDWASALDTDSEFVTQQLNETERNILALYASGATADYVARRVGLATNTVNKYIAVIRRKFMDAGLPAGSRVDLLRRAQQEGLVPTHDSPE